MEREIYGGSSNRRKLAFDTTLAVEFTGPEGEPLSPQDLQDFEVDFYIDRDPSRKVTCAKRGEEFIGCRLSDAAVEFAIPGGVFELQGALIFDMKTRRPDPLYPDGVEDNIVGVDTGLIMVK